MITVHYSLRTKCTQLCDPLRSPVLQIVIRHNNYPKVVRYLKGPKLGPFTLKWHQNLDNRVIGYNAKGKSFETVSQLGKTCFQKPVTVTVICLLIWHFHLQFLYIWTNTLQRESYVKIRNSTSDFDMFNFKSVVH